MYILSKKCEPSFHCDSIDLSFDFVINWFWGLDFWSRRHVVWCFPRLSHLFNTSKLVHSIRAPMRFT